MNPNAHIRAGLRVKQAALEALAGASRGHWVPRGRSTDPTEARGPCSDSPGSRVIR